MPIFRELHVLAHVGNEIALNIKIMYFEELIMQYLERSNENKFTLI